MKYLRLLLLPLSGVYWLIIMIKNILYDKNILKVYKSKIPIVCVGNISTGGTGKTPLLLTISKGLLDKGKNIAILSRGYKRKTEGYLEVDEINPEKFGDEPAMLIRNLNNVNIVVSENRVKGIENIARSYKPDFILMDDGLQNRSVYKNFSIAVIDESYKKNNLLDRILIPAGNLREPSSHLRDFDVVIRNRKFAEKDNENFANVENQNLFSAKYSLEGIYDLNGNRIELNELWNIPPQPRQVEEDMSAQTSRNRQVRIEKKSNNFIFCGIANPKSFEQMFDSIGINYSGKKFFGDHHSYSKNDVLKIISLAKKLGSTNLITTEKDIARLQRFGDIFIDNDTNILYTKIKAEIVNFENLIEQIINKTFIN